MFIILPTIYYVHRFNSLSFFSLDLLQRNMFKDFTFLLLQDTVKTHFKNSLQIIALNHTTEYLKHKT